jgi:hypothetical protein
MPDLLVNLLKLPPLENSLRDLEQSATLVRRAQAFEIGPVRKFIEENFSVAWADEASVGFANKPVSVLISTHDNRICGFAAYECTRRAFFGPTGVAESDRGRGIGKALLIAGLWGLREMGYVYGIIGGAGPVDFYQRTVDATIIPDSEPGIYSDLLK